MNGPIFIVGMSRSGTKLLREMLNKHPLVFVPRHESHFIPHLLTTFAARGSAPDAESRRRFIRYYLDTGFSRNMARDGHALGEAELEALTAQDTWPEVVASLFKHVSGCAEPGIVWGDKSPKYLFHMELLARHFPEARFLHIIRDPRDRAISAQAAWGANLYLSAQQWRDGMHAAISARQAIRAAYHEVHYEQLVKAPVPTIRALCDFLALEFNSEMLVLDAPVERRGDPGGTTRTETAIVATQIGNFQHRLTQRQLNRIEEIVFPMAKGLGYVRATGECPYRPLGSLERIFWSVPHHLSGLTQFTRRWGVVDGIRQAWMRFRL